MGQEKGNCSFQKNPTPCIVPQEQENIFHTIFAFFTKSGRKVLVRMCFLVGSTWVVLTRKANLRWEASFLFGIYYFPNLVLISCLRKSQGLWSAPVFQPEVSFKVLNWHLKFHCLAKGKPLQPTKHEAVKHFSNEEPNQEGCSLYNHFGKLLGSLLKLKIFVLVTQEFHSQVYPQEKWVLVFPKRHGQESQSFYYSQKLGTIQISIHCGAVIR